MLRRFRVTVTHTSVFQSHSLEFFIGQEFTNDFLETLRWSVYFKKKERTRNTKEKKKHRPFRNAQHLCCSWWRKEKNIYEEANGNLVVPNPSMFMVQLIALTFVIDFFVVSCKCTKPSFTRNSWLQSQEYKWCEEFVVPFIPIHFGNGCFFTTTRFRFHQNQRWTYLLFFPIPSKSVKFSFLVSLTCHFKSCQFQL